jgi:hypothetical protein
MQRYLGSAPAAVHFQTLRPPDLAVFEAPCALHQCPRPNLGLPPCAHASMAGEGGPKISLPFVGPQQVRFGTLKRCWAVLAMDHGLAS